MLDIKNLFVDKAIKSLRIVKLKIGRKK